MRRTKHQKTIGLCIFVVLATCFLLPQSTHAQTHTTSLTAMPAVIDIGGRVGTEVKFSFQLTNNAETILPIHMSSRDSRARDGQAEGTMRSLSAKDWVIYTEPDFILQAKETRRVDAVLKVPDDAGPGGHYADLVVQSLNLEGDDSVITTQPEIAIQMLVSVAGDIKEDLSATLDGPSTIILNPSVPNSLAFTVKNNGNIHSMFMPRIHLKHKRQDGFIISSEPQIILPGETKELRFDLPADLRPGLHNTQMAITYGTPSKEAPGPQVNILVLPFSPKLLLFVPLLVGAIFIYKGRRRIVSAVRVISKGEHENPKK